MVINYTEEKNLMHQEELYYSVPLKGYGEPKLLRKPTTKNTQKKKRGDERQLGEI